MEAILNVGTKAVIPPKEPKAKPTRPFLDSEEVVSGVDFGYMSSDDETVSTVSSDIYPSGERQLLTVRPRIKPWNAWIETRSDLSVKFSLDRSPPSFFNYENVNFDLKVEGPTEVITYQITQDNVLRFWNIINRGGYDPTQFPYIPKETFLRFYGHLIQKRLEKGSSPDSKPAVQSKSWSVGSIFDALCRR
jgi:hypothetical protein